MPPAVPTPTAPPPANPPSPDRGGPVVTVTLTSGETLRGVLKAVDGEKIVLTHSVLGDVSMPRTGIASSEPPIDNVLAPPPPSPKPEAPKPEPPKPEAPKPDAPKPDAPKPDAPKPAAQQAAAEAANPAAKPTEKPPEKAKPVPPTNPIAAIFAEDEKHFLEGWTRQVEFGMNGVTGPSDSQNYRLVVNLNRRTSKMGTTAQFSYAYGQNNAGTTQNRGEFSGRNDWNLGATPWTFWASTRGEVDERARWDSRFSLATGVGYTVWKDSDKDPFPRITLVARGGVGGAREFGSDRNEIIPEVGIVGLTADAKFSDRVSAYASTEYFPSGRRWDWDNFRSVSRAGLNFTIDPELKMNLRTGIEHRHDSEARGDFANIIEYFVVLGFAF
jgi:hypothetical protein